MSARLKVLMKIFNLNFFAWYHFPDVRFQDVMDQVIRLANFYHIEGKCF